MNTTTEKQLREFAAKGLLWTEVSSHLGIPVGYIRTAAMTLGISGTRERCPQSSRSELLDCVERLKKGETINEIAGSLGIAPNTLYGRLRRAQMPTTMRAAVKASRA